MLFAGSALKGYSIAARDGGIGTVADLLFDDTRWNVRWVVVDTGTWLTSRKVLLHPSAVTAADHEARELAVALTKQQVEDSPSILRDQPVSQQLENSLYDYYGWDPLWGGSYFGAGAIAAPFSAPPYFGFAGPKPPERLPGEEGDPHLQSLYDVTGYHILANDGEIGHLENALVDDGTWTIRYLIVDTSNWWVGKHVLLSPYAVKGVNLADQQIAVEVRREQVESSPPWEPAEVINPDYEKRLHNHYGWRGYGW
jgi:hypothetical protein